MNDAIAATRPQSALSSPATPPQGSGDDEFKAFGDDGFTFFDFLDIINPLQHIPLVSTLYRDFTGDEIDPGSRIAGGTLFGGPIGAALSVTDVMVEDNTGKDLGEHVLALFNDDKPTNESAPEPPVEIAALMPAPVTTAQTAWSNPPITPPCCVKLLPATILKISAWA